MNSLVPLPDVLKFLLDAHIDPAVAREVFRHRPTCTIVSLRDWENGVFLNEADALILDTAAKQALTLVTFDLQSIPSLVRKRGAASPHAGVVVVDDRTMRSNDTGDLVRSLIQLWDEAKHEDWTNIVQFLRPAPPASYR